MNKKFMIVMITFLLTMSNVVFANGTKINDIEKSSSYATDSIKYLAELQVISGDENGNFNPQKSVTRVEMVALLVKALGLDTTNIPSTATFKDVPLSNWASKYVEKAYKEGIITGVSESEFRPNNQITREEMAVLFVRALKIHNKNNEIEINNINVFTDKVNISSWAENEVELAIETGLMNGISLDKFEPKAFANKEQSAVVVQRLMKNKVEIINAFKVTENNQMAPKLMVNGQPVQLNNELIAPKGTLFIPIELINKLPLNRHYIEVVETGPIFSIDLNDEYYSAGFRTLWMQVGQKVAYKNLGGDPLQPGVQVPAENQLPMENAPILVGEKLYVPAKDIFRILNINFRYDEAANTVIIDDSKIGNPELFYALRQLVHYGYVGDLKYQSILKLNDGKSKNHIITQAALDKQRDNYTITSYTKKTYDEIGKTPTVIQQEVTIIGNDYYRKDFTDGKWLKYSTRAEKIHLNAPFYDPLFKDMEIESSEMNSKFLENLSRIETEYEDIVYVSGIRAKKYVMRFDLNTIKNTMSDADYQVVTAYVNKAMYGKLDYKYEFYIAKDKLIKQTFQFNGVYLDPETGDDYHYNAHSTLLYKNIGKQPYIVAPPATAIKNVRN